MYFDFYPKGDREPLEVFEQRNDISDFLKKNDGGGVILHQFERAPFLHGFWLGLVKATFVPYLKVGRKEVAMYSEGQC